MITDLPPDFGLFALSLGTEDDFQEVATVGLVQGLERDAVHGFQLQLLGCRRVTLRRVDQGKPYPVAAVTPHPDRIGTRDPLTIEEARLALVGTYGILQSIVNGREPLVRHQDLPFETLVNTACARMSVEAPLRQRLLQEDTLIGRQQMAMQCLSSVIETLRWLKTQPSAPVAFVH
jgi:hypothetical protein